MAFKTKTGHEDGEKNLTQTGGISSNPNRNVKQ